MMPRMHSLIKETSKLSINLRSDTLTFAPANRWYSSNTEARHQFCSFLKQPTRQPVRCCVTKKKKKKNQLNHSSEFDVMNKVCIYSYLPSFAVNQHWMIPYIWSNRIMREKKKIKNCTFNQII